MITRDSNKILNSLCSNFHNQQHIDRLILIMKNSPDVWDERIRSVIWDAPWYNAMMIAKQIINKTYIAHIKINLELLATSVNRRGRHPSWISAPMGAIYGLVAWEDSNRFLEMSAAELEVWAHLSEEPAAILLLPAVIAFEQIDLSFMS